MLTTILAFINIALFMSPIGDLIYISSPFFLLANMAIQFFIDHKYRFKVVSLVVLLVSGALWAILFSIWTTFIFPAPPAPVFTLRHHVGSPVRPPPTTPADNNDNDNNHHCPVPSGTKGLFGCDPLVFYPGRTPGGSLPKTPDYMALFPPVSAPAFFYSPNQENDLDVSKNASF